MATIEIQLNGAMKQVPAHFTAQDLVDSLALGEQRVAMEINLEIVPRSQYRATPIKSGDVVEIVHAIGGGQN